MSKTKGKREKSRITCGEAETEQDPVGLLVQTLSVSPLSCLCLVT